MSEIEELRAELARVSAERDSDRERTLAEFALGAEELTVAEKKVRAAQRATQRAERQVAELRAELQQTKKQLQNITNSSAYPVFRAAQRSARLARRVRARVIRATRR